MTNRNRITFDVSDRQYEFLKALPHGYLTNIYRALTELLILAVAEHGMSALGPILSRSIKLERFLNNGND